MEDVTIYHLAFEVVLVLVVIKLMFFSKNEPQTLKEEKPTPKASIAWAYIKKD